MAKEPTKKELLAIIEALRAEMAIMKAIQQCPLLHYPQPIQIKPAWPSYPQYPWGTPNIICQDPPFQLFSLNAQING